MYDMILIRYGEMTLKKSNYKQFLKRINENIKEKIKEFDGVMFKNNDYRAYIYLNGVDANLVKEKLDEVVGLHSYSLCKEVSKNIEDIAKWSIKIIEDTIAKGLIKTPFTFKVETNRGDKTFPMNSLEVSQKVAAQVLPKIDGMTVDVHNPDLTLSIDLRCEGAYIYTSSYQGLGGYPSGMAANALVMMSGGIDSPVAGYLAIKKGVTISAIHFAAPPYTSLEALEKVKDLLKVLTKYQSGGKIDLYVVPLTDIEVKIHKEAAPDYMITLLRRSMYRIATRIANNGHFKALVNGESVGQVASQTLESMWVVNDVTSMPILRPLCAMDKIEIINIAKKIKTFDISIRPYEDCCTVFVPTHPVIKPTINEAKFNEDKCNLAELEDIAVRDTEVITITAD